MLLTRKYLKKVDLIKKTDYNTKIIDIEGKIPNITGLADTAALNSIPDRGWEWAFWPAAYFDPT